MQLRRILAVLRRRWVASLALTLAGLAIAGQLSATVESLSGDGTLHILTSGEVPPNPSELLASPTMSRLLMDLEARYDYVILDTAPLLPAASRRQSEERALRAAAELTDSDVDQSVAG